MRMRTFNIFFQYLQQFTIHITQSNCFTITYYIIIDRKDIIMKETLIKQWDNILNLLEIEYDVSHMMINTWIRALSIKEVN